MVEKSPPISRRRQETRRRLIDAALDVFAERGFGSSTVDQVCERAKFTKGAFYSNFAALDELFLAAWEQRSAQMLAAVEALVADRVCARVSSTRDVVEQVLETIPVDDKWYRLTAEFTAHALRNPSLKRVVAAREETILATLMPLLELLVAQLGREIADAAAFGSALVAVHDGTTVQCLIDSDTDAARARRTDLFVLLVEHHTREIRS
ncbi:TetR/AcrR family transcriptional regulator [Nocardia salmonicida]|uniref:TetR/AcrR family transcriptional regulator n=1 Tax=Nocardia salmonicida TaxID=53431 RepID=UPI00340B0D95